MRRSALAVPALALAAALAAGLGAAAARFDGAVVEDAILGGEGGKIAVSIYAPREPLGPPERRPAVVLCHGISASRRHMDPLARAFARAGLLTVSFDYGAHGDSDDRPGREEGNAADVKAAIALARARGASGPVALIGHSMGVTSAVQTALDDPGVACVVALGQRPFATPERPPALLVAAGAMDAFHPYGSLLAAARASSGRAIAAFETATAQDAAGKPTGAVRRLFFSGSCEHAGEVYDGAIAAEALRFVSKALGLPEPAGGGWRVPLDASLRFVAAALSGGALAALGLLLAAIAPRAARGVAALLVVLAVTPLALAWAGLVPVGAARSWLPGLLAGALAANARIVRRPDAPVTGGAGDGIVTALGLALGWVLGSALAALPAWRAHPDLLAGLPLYLWQAIAFRLQFTADALASRLLAAPLSGEVHGTVPLYALLALELLLPGRAFGIAARFAVRIFRALGGLPKLPSEVERECSTSDRGSGPSRAASGSPGGLCLPGAERSRLFLRLSAEPGPSLSRRDKKAALAVLAGLLALGALIFWKRSREGLLAEEGAVLTVALTGLRLFVLPLAGLWMAAGIARLVRRGP